MSWSDVWNGVGQVRIGLTAAGTCCYDADDNGFAVWKP